MTLTRGERNNNPGNIREYDESILWRGERSTDDDPEFEEFETPEAGIRALAKVLLTYQQRYGIRTIRGFIRRWAPSNENDTEAYIKHVATMMKISDTASIFLSDRTIMRALVKSIIIHENGRCIYPNSTILRGVELAYG